MEGFFLLTNLINKRNGNDKNASFNDEKQTNKQTNKNSKKVYKSIK